MATRQIHLFESKPAAALRIGHVETEALAAGYRWILGVDEAGRGPLAGPVTAAGVLIDLQSMAWCDGITDSKKLTARARTQFCDTIFAHAEHVVCEHISVQEVDRMNVLAASLWGMRRCAEEILAVRDVDPKKLLVIVDGKQMLPDFAFAQQALVKGDARSLAVASASVVAKVRRDAWMQELHEAYPVYGFDRHKGYPTKMHLEALQKHGACPHHRRSFAPVAATIEAKRRP